jgi:ribose transport system ATP-binding protein
MKDQLLFEAKNIKKSFHGTQALKGVDFDIKKGEVVGLIGENGAGKSTLLKIIIGVEAPTAGEMFIEGESFLPKTPMDANEKGIGMVFQEQSLITNLSVGQNIFFGYEKDFRKFFFVNWNKMYEESQKALDNVGALGISPRKKVLDYNFATRQLVEIAKVVNVSIRSGAENCLILLDEPTSLLNEDEVKALFVEVRKLTAMGHSIIFVSHRLDEVLELTDRIFVYKDGMGAGVVDTDDADERKLYEMMVGRSTTTEYYKIDQQREPEDEVVIECKDLGLSGVFKHVDFTLRKGEVLGIAGVVGSGKEDICSVLCGDDVATSGEYYLKGKKVNFTSPNQALKHNILMVPKERLVEGIVSTLSIAENIAMSQLKKPSVGPFVSSKKVKEQAKVWIDKLRVKTKGYQELVLQLSGGNQQKVVFARALASECDVLILNHPTRGVDVGAKEDLYTLVREMTNEGKSVILLGDTLDECIGLSNRVLVMKDGLITGELDSPATNKLKQVDVVSLMM